MHSINEILHCRVWYRLSLYILEVEKGGSLKFRNIKLDPGILVNTFDINENGYYYALVEEKIVLQYCIF